jgi:hypothetical protein
MAKLEIDGVSYFSASELLVELGVSRQTLWRWRQQRKIPAGHRYRDKTILFTADEVELIRQYANRIEPNEKANEQPGFRQLGLFNGIASRMEQGSKQNSKPKQASKKLSWIKK